MHALGCAEDGIHRAGLDALGAADAFGFPNKGHPAWLLATIVGVQRQRLAVQQSRQRVDGVTTAGRTMIDGLARGNALGVGMAAGMSALTTLGLWQQRVDAGDQQGLPFVPGGRDSRTIERALPAS